MGGRRPRVDRVWGSLDRYPYPRSWVTSKEAIGERTILAIQCGREFSRSAQLRDPVSIVPITNDEGVECPDGGDRTIGEVRPNDVALPQRTNKHQARGVIPCALHRKRSTHSSKRYARTDAGKVCDAGRKKRFVG